MSEFEFTNGLEEYAEKGELPSEWEILRETSSNDGSIEYLDLATPDIQTFVKVFSQPNIEQAEHEFTNGKYFETKQGWLSPVMLHYIKGDDKSILAYEFIEGETLQEYFSRRKNAGEVITSEDIYEPVRQIANLSLNLPSETAQTLYLSSFKTPRTFDLLTRVDTSIPANDIHESWEAFMTTINSLSSYIPGYYFDRNPRNMIKGKSGIYQVDTEIITPASPLLDLSIFLRTGFDASSAYSIPEEDKYFDSQEERKQAIGVLSVFSPSVEQEIVSRFTDLHLGKSQNSPAELSPLYDAATAYTHIHFLQFPLANKLDKPQNYNIKPRHAYHGISAVESLDRIKTPEALEQIHHMVPNLSLREKHIMILQKAVKNASRLLIK